MAKIVLLLLYMAATVAVVVAELQRFEHPVKSDGSLSFLVVGDWGRRGLYNQSNVAYQMGDVGEKMDVDFIVSTGDNFYDSGLIDEDDPAFFESFTVYWVTMTTGVMSWHNLAQPSNKEIANGFALDLLSSMLDVDAALKGSSAKWKIVVGHHTIFSAGHHGNTEELVDKLLPILEANKVNLYINGHDHCLEHITSPNSQLQFLTSGGGSKAWRGAVKPFNLDAMKFYYDGQGFMAAEITENEAYVAFYDIFGNMLHKWSSYELTHTAS
ncbi:hypothetical protein Ccrd_001534 [Cynara cardunculus var. scolymus]|uniref:acid phosphatase n=1 Tax=Cynara cardunculus var. scolymus TaxID=59895 RepID=A0A124SDB1_CYNCS|nr:hypothetical protein Ccrd_001534 [Cynara cardunculus var. scolymus]